MKHIQFLTRRLFAATILVCAALTATAQVSNQPTTKVAPTNGAAQAPALQCLQFDSAGRHVEAIEAYTHALLLTPNNVGIYNDLGYNYACLKRYEEAVAALTHALALNPEIAITHYNLGEVYEITGRNTEALAEYSRALKIDPKYNKAHVKLCQIQLMLGHDDEGVACYETLLSLAPQDAETRTNYGYVLNRL